MMAEPVGGRAVVGSARVRRNIRIVFRWGGHPPYMRPSWFQAAGLVVRQGKPANSA